MHVALSVRARKFLDKLTADARHRIEERLKRLSQDPVPRDAKFLGRDDLGERVFRYRIGEYRALYKLKRDQVLVAKIDKRPRVYRR